MAQGSPLIIRHEAQRLVLVSVTAVSRMGWNPTRSGISMRFKLFAGIHGWLCPVMCYRCSENRRKDEGQHPTDSNIY